jgi:hypothetical protein
MRGGLLGMFITGWLCTYNPSYFVEGMQYMAVYCPGSFSKPLAMEYRGV